MKQYQGISYLKVMLTFFVVAHHAFLAFTPSGYGSPIHDKNTTEVFSYITGVFDNFFMYTFFFIAGLFAYKSIISRGKVSYILSRVIRLGLVFFVATYTVNIVGFYLMEVFKGSNQNIFLSFENFIEYYGFVVRYFYPTQHLWFLWVLLLFNIIFAFLLPFFKKERTLLSRLHDEGNFFMNCMLSLGILLYIVGTLIFGYEFVNLIGPFSAQIGRLPAYFMMYIFGIILGKNGLEKSFIIKKFNKKITMRILFIGLISGLIFTHLLIQERFDLLFFTGDILTAITFVFMTLALVALFLNFSDKNSKVMSMLSEHAFLIYILHYGIISALQGVFYNIDLNGFIEGIIVFLIGSMLSILFAYLLRKIKLIQKVI